MDSRGRVHSPEKRKASDHLAASCANRATSQGGCKFHSGQDLSLLAVELLGRDNAPVTQLGKLGQLVRRTL